MKKNGIEKIWRNRRGGGESTTRRMSRKCQLAMKSINKDLKFTVECPEDFADKREPTLDFSIWMEKNKVLHSYFEKDMKTPLDLMKRTAMSEQQKYSILSNELVRRLSNISQELKEDQRKREKIWVVDIMTQKMRNSGYTRMETAEALICGI